MQPTLVDPSGRPLSVKDAVEQSEQNRIQQQMAQARISTEISNWKNYVDALSGELAADTLKGVELTKNIKMSAHGHSMLWRACNTAKSMVTIPDEQAGGFLTSVYGVILGVMVEAPQIVNSPVFLATLACIQADVISLKTVDAKETPEIPDEEINV